MTRATSRKLLYLALSLLALLCIVRLAQPDPPGSQDFSARGTRITRFHQSSPPGTVFVVHSVYQDHFTCLPMARALWKGGVEVVVVEFKAGLGFGDYVSELQELVRRESEGGPVYGVGHSMGADIVFSTQGFSGRAALGFPVDTSQADGIVLVGAGAWDQVHTRATLKEAAGDAPLMISPFSDHSQESLDPLLQSAVSEAFGGQSDFIWPSKVLAQGAYVLAGSLLLVGLLPAGPSRARSLSMSLTAAALLGLHLVFPHPLLCASAVTLWLGCAWSQSGETSAETRRLLRVNLFIVSGVAGASWALHSYQNVWAEPWSILGLPVAVFSWYPILASRFTNMIAGWPVVLFALLLLETVFPGKLFSGLRSMVGRFYRRLVSSDFRPQLGANKVQLATLFFLLAVCSLVWARTLAAGYTLDSHDLARLLWKLASLLILPLALWVVMVRRLSGDLTQ